MSSHTTRPATALQADSPTDCRHSREPFHALFRVIATRRDISPVAKLVHQALVSMRRTGKCWTQTEIGEEVGLSRHQVWKGLSELIAAGLVRTTRRGLGQPNTYELLGLDLADLDGTAPRHQDAGQHNPASRRPTTPKNSGKDQKQTGIPGAYTGSREQGWVMTDRGLRWAGPVPL